ncbi:hypothetical protein ACCO45_004253 [Purpureocillium lilacinum]|uniref:Uncharacterized protein n=1 Tax=Purpureocillium lilacinum TaxID=33203 RepID=A0ACC4E272_PURLI
MVVAGVVPLAGRGVCWRRWAEEEDGAAKLGGGGGLMDEEGGSPSRGVAPLPPRGDVAVYLGGDLLRDGQAPRRRLLPGGQHFERLVVAARLCDHLLFRVRGLVLGTLAKNSVPQIPQQLADDRRRQVNIPANSLALVPPTLLAHVGFRDGVVELIHLRDVVLPRVPLTCYGGWQRSLIGLVVFDTGHVSQHRALEEPEADYLRRDLERHDDVDGVAAHERCELLGGHGEEGYRSALLEGARTGG